MTYGALAKHILSTNDWATLHYTDQAYANFYQHPPLAIWMMALTMKIFGTGDWVLRLLPAVVSGIGIVGVYLWGKKIRGEWFAFTTAFILLTSTRYLKYSKGFMLDPFLSTFSIWSIYLTILAIEKKSSRFASAAGALLTAALLSKGLFAFAPLALSFFLFSRSTRLAAGYLLGVSVPLTLWFYFGHAQHYIARYYIEHVSERVGHHTFSEHLAPMINLGKVYWPWLPFYIFGIYQLAKKYASLPNLKSASNPETVAGFASLFFLGGFVLVASFLEQYHTSFYPFAALVVAFALPEGRESTQKKIVYGLYAVLVCVSTAMLIQPTSFHGTEAQHPMRIALKSAREKCASPEVHRIAISTGVAEIWYALAMGTWNTDWDAFSTGPGASPGAARSQLLLASVHDSLDSRWKGTGIKSGEFEIFQPIGKSYCRTN
ncbi:MAG: glycosyltransferase family 39 protein [Cryobacterium sp.]|nr:glycosyltransferase family 39 protein [Oligoflexia bacterium]